MGTLKLQESPSPLYMEQRYIKQNKILCGVRQYLETQNIVKVTDTYSELLQYKTCFINMNIQQTERRYPI
jgi:hypothetical protein